MRAILFLLSLLLISPNNGMAKDPPKPGEKDKSITIDIPTDLPLPPSAEEVLPTHPFFSATSTGGEVMEKLQELEDRIEKLEKSVGPLEKRKE